jgi:hypothetical protein
METSSATDIDEASLAEFLFTNQTIPKIHLTELGVNAGCLVRLAVKTSSLFAGEQLPGDIDVLIQHDKTTGFATAIELKRIKIPVRAFNTGMPTKIQDLKRGVHQANALHELGFGRVILLIAIVTDGRDQTGVTWPYRGPTAGHLSKIRNFPGRELLNPQVGLAFVEAMQPTDRPLQTAGGLTAYFKQTPVSRVQSPEVSQTICQYFANSQLVETRS